MSNRSDSPENEMVIEYGAWRHPVKEQWYPWISDDRDHRRRAGIGGPYYEVASAIAAAREEAEVLAVRYRGDWIVRIEECAS